MPEEPNRRRRSFLAGAGAGVAAAGLGFAAAARAAERVPPGKAVAGSAGALAKLEPIRQVRVGDLSIGYYEAGPANGIPVLLDARLPVRHPQLRRRGAAARRAWLSRDRAAPARPRHDPLPRHRDAAQRAAGGRGARPDRPARRAPHRARGDGRLRLGARTACVLAALWPQRCRGLLSAGGYIITSLAATGCRCPPRRSTTGGISSTSPPSGDAPA
jgi:hypothetical protein